VPTVFEIEDMRRIGRKCGLKNLDCAVAGIWSPERRSLDLVKPFLLGVKTRFLPDFIIPTAPKEARTYKVVLYDIFIGQSELSLLFLAVDQSPRAEAQ